MRELGGVRERDGETGGGPNAGGEDGAEGERAGGEAVFVRGVRGAVGSRGEEYGEEERCALVFAVCDFCLVFGDDSLGCLLETAEWRRRRRVEEGLELRGGDVAFGGRLMAAGSLGWLVGC